MKAPFKAAGVMFMPFVFMLFINAVSSPPAGSYMPGRCTRYCEAHGCLHFRYKYNTKEEILNKWWHKIYRWNIRALHHIPGLSYHEANIAVYFVLYPLLIFGLLYRLLNKI